MFTVPYSHIGIHYKQDKTNNKIKKSKPKIPITTIKQDGRALNIENESKETKISSGLIQDKLKKIQESSNYRSARSIKN